MSGSRSDAQPTLRLDRADDIELSPVAVELPDPADGWLPGLRVGRYELRECIGAGGLGVVFAGFDPKLGREVAVKVLRRDRAALADHRARVLREAQAMAQVRHQNVVEVYDVGETDDANATVYIVMELLDGVSLQEWLARRPSWRAIVVAFVEAARGLAAAHRRGVIHRDFKPTNAMMGTDGHVRVLDFGLARGSIDDAAVDATMHRSNDDMLAVDLTDADKVLGTPPYMAPEQHIGDRVDGRSDQFALCVALFEGLFGCRPFRGATLRELTDAKLDGRIARVDGIAVPAALRRVIERGLSPHPDLRFADMNELASALERVLVRPRWNPLAILGAAATVSAALLAVPVLGGRAPTTPTPVATLPLPDDAAAGLAPLLEREAASWALRADVARRSGRLEEALEAASRALELLRALHHEDHPANVAGRVRVENVLRDVRHRDLDRVTVARNRP